MLGSLGGLIVLGFGGWLVIEGDMQVGTLVAFNAYLAVYLFGLPGFLWLRTRRRWVPIAGR